MNRKSLLIFVWLCITTLPTQAQPPALEKSLFWEVSGKGKAKMYILGTHHLYANDFVKNSIPIQKALKKSSIIVG